jgi:hypothetical protein
MNDKQINQNQREWDRYQDLTTRTQQLIIDIEQQITNIELLRLEILYFFRYRNDIDAVRND